jgi:hypothetical protein
MVLLDQHGEEIAPVKAVEFDEVIIHNKFVNSLGIRAKKKGRTIEFEILPRTMDEPGITLVPVNGNYIIEIN